MSNWPLLSILIWLPVLGGAMVLALGNRAGAAMVGLCVGHDSLFFKYSSAPVTVLIAKDRVLGHNPAAGLYLSKSYYRKLRRKEP